MAKHMRIDERKRIEFLLGCGMKVAQIAVEVGRPDSTMVREIITKRIDSDKCLGCFNRLCLRFDECMRKEFTGLGERLRSPISDSTSDKKHLNKTQTVSSNRSTISNRDRESRWHERARPFESARSLPTRRRLNKGGSAERTRKRHGFRMPSAVIDWERRKSMAKLFETCP